MSIIYRRLGRALYRWKVLGEPVRTPYRLPTSVENGQNKVARRYQPSICKFLTIYKNGHENIRTD
jgi:hypothetical protein